MIFRAFIRLFDSLVRAKLLIPYNIKVNVNLGI